jgi:hypothetical protein
VLFCLAGNLEAVVYEKINVSCKTNCRKLSHSDIEIVDAGDGRESLGNVAQPCTTIHEQSLLSTTWLTTHSGRLGVNQQSEVKPGNLELFKLFGRFRIVEKRNSFCGRQIFHGAALQIWGHFLLEAIYVNMGARNCTVNQFDSIWQSTIIISWCPPYHINLTLLSSHAYALLHEHKSQPDSYQINRASRSQAEKQEKSKSVIHHA